eukprot:12922044-Alexandrium_andersonii.AAC.1
MEWPDVGLMRDSESSNEPVSTSSGPSSSTPMALCDSFTWFVESPKLDSDDLSALGAALGEDPLDACRNGVRASVKAAAEKSAEEGVAKGKAGAKAKPMAKGDLGLRRPPVVPQ